jgi:hypothetical protein
MKLEKPKKHLITTVQAFIVQTEFKIVSLLPQQSSHMPCTFGRFVNFVISFCSPFWTLFSLFLSLSLSCVCADIL